MYKSKKIEVVQIIRLFASICIIIYHSNIFGEHGYFAVDIFSVMSGYILMYSTQRINSKQHFLYNRWIRIAPLYWFFTFCTYILIYYVPSLSIMSEAKIPYLLKSMFFIPFVNEKGYSVPIMGIGWTLNYEMLFYFIFWIAMMVNHRYRGVISSGIISIIVACGYICKIDNYLWEHYTNSFMLEFVFGIVLFYLKDLVKRNAESRKYKVLSAGLCFLCMCIMAFDIGVNTNVIRSIRLGVPAFIFVLIVISYFEQKSFPKWLVCLGNATYSIYLLEYFTTAFYKAVVGYFAPIIGGGLFVIILVGTLVMGYFIHILMEKPTYIKLKK